VFPKVLPKVVPKVGPRLLRDRSEIDRKTEYSRKIPVPLTKVKQKKCPKSGQENGSAQQENGSAQQNKFRVTRTLASTLVRGAGILVGYSTSIFVCTTGRILTAPMVTGFFPIFENMLFCCRRVCAFSRFQFSNEKPLVLT
jgi:hypothetical protein